MYSLFNAGLCDADSSLKSLYLGENSITNIGKGIVKCGQLRFLELGDNELVKLDLDFKEMDSLKELRMSKNKLGEVTYVGCPQIGHFEQ